MAQQIDISNKTLKRLDNRMRGFESYNDLISFLINFYEYELGAEAYIEPSISLEIQFDEEMDSETFKTRLLKDKIAWIHLQKTDGTIELKKWNASKITRDSKIINNLRSGQLRGWKNKGITKAIVSFTNERIIEGQYEISIDDYELS